MKQLREQRGFTLVEVIVVMVIIAILAAMLLPSLTGYIKEANDKSVMVEAKTVMTAAQSIASELYGMGVSEKGIINYLMGDSMTNEDIALKKTYHKTVESLSGVKMTEQGRQLTEIRTGKDSVTGLTDGTLVSLKYKTGGKTVEYKNGELTII